MNKIIYFCVFHNHNKMYQYILILVYNIQGKYNVFLLNLSIFFQIIIIVFIIIYKMLY